jgi:hypothetical protein
MSQFLARLAYQRNAWTAPEPSALTVTADNGEQAEAAVAVALRSLQATEATGGFWECRWVVEIDAAEVQLMFDARRKLPEGHDALRLTGRRASELLPGPGERDQTCPAEERHARRGE